MRLSDRVHVDVVQRPEFLSVFLRLAGIGYIAFVWLVGWNRYGLTHKGFAIIALVGVSTDLIRLFCTREHIDIGRQQITLASESLWKRERSYQSDQISDFSFNNEKEDHTFMEFRTSPWLMVRFAHNISDEDARLLLEAVGSIGGIGKAVHSDPYDGHLTSLNLSR